MLTTAQTAMHWRRWGAVADANDWVMIGGRLVGMPSQSSFHHRLVWKTAEALALHERRAVTADDLRHACYVVATTAVPGWGQRARPMDSMKDLGNREFSRLLCLWGDGKTKRGLLIEPDCLTSQIAWDHPEQDAAAGLDQVLKRSAPDATLRSIAANAFGTRLWEDLDVPKKKWLLSEVKHRVKKWNRPVKSEVRSQNSEVPVNAHGDPEW